jgi:hypothetical protein
MVVSQKAIWARSRESRAQSKASTGEKIGSSLFSMDSLVRLTLLQRGAKPAQERNEINGRGPPSAGRMPFMSDSTLSRRSAALRRLEPPN